MGGVGKKGGLRGNARFITLGTGEASGMEELSDPLGLYHSSYCLLTQYAFTS